MHPVASEFAIQAWSLLEAVQVAVVVHDATGRVVHSNSRAAELLGLLPSGWTLVGEDGEPLPHSALPVTRALATRAAVDLVVGVRRQTDLAWAKVHAGPRFDQAGQLVQVVATWVDITESRKVEQALRDSELKYRTLYDSMDAAVLLMAGKVCVDCNPATAALFGLPDRTLIVGKTPLDFAPELQPDGRRSADVVEEHIALALQHHGRAFEWHTVRADGAPIILEVLFTPFGLGAGTLFQCVARDITQRKRAEVSLRESEARFRAIIERAAEGIVVAELGTRAVRYANPEMCRLLGHSPDELSRLTVAELHPPEVTPWVGEQFERQARGELTEITTLCRRKDGSTFEANIRGIPIQFDGRPCMAGFFWDTTNARLLEEERLRTQKLEAVGILAGGIAHDFNNLLQAVFGFVAVAKEAAGMDEARALLSQAEEALELAVGLTTQLLTFSRGGRPVKKPIALAPTVESAARLALSGSANHCVKELPAELWPVEADSGQLAQVIQNIVLNADQAMSAGGTVTIAARNVMAPHASLPPQLAQGPFVAISIRDGGVGIRPEHLARVFDPYFTTKATGTGLGLATAYSVVKNHGGFIEVQSTLGQGSTFTVYLPATRAPLPASPAEVPAPAPRGARVLMMDDEELIRRVSGNLLRSLGHEVDLAEHGAEAISLYEAALAAGKPYDVVILDLTVRGGLGGVETIARLRQLDPSVKAIVSSGYSEDAAVADHRAHGFVAALNKPYTFGQLKQALASVCA